jgi:hypothetical protein
VTQTREAWLLRGRCQTERERATYYRSKEDCLAVDLPAHLIDVWRQVVPASFRIEAEYSTERELEIVFLPDTATTFRCAEKPFRSQVDSLQPVALGGCLRSVHELCNRAATAASRYTF